jgi:hypothetical protein
MAAAPFVCAPFLGVVWCVARLFGTAPRGRQRVPGLAALDATTPELFTVTTLPSLTAMTVCELLGLLASAPPGVPLTLGLAKARSQRCPLGQTLARSLASEWLFVPPYSPNLTLSERFGTFVKKQWLYSTYSADPHAFEQASRTCIAQAPTLHRAALASLLTLKFQPFTAVPVLGAESNVPLFPVATKAHPQVSSQAA